jgi:hypothetical protein
MVPGASAELIGRLAAQPAATQDLALQLIRQARKDALAEDKARRKQARRDRRLHPAWTSPTAPPRSSG